MKSVGQNFNSKLKNIHFAHMQQTHQYRPRVYKCFSQQKTEHLTLIDL